MLTLNLGYDEHFLAKSPKAKIECVNLTIIKL